MYFYEKFVYLLDIEDGDVGDVTFEEGGVKRCIGDWAAEIFN